jgi:hypothetical protein
MMKPTLLAAVLAVPLLAPIAMSREAAYFRAARAFNKSGSFGSSSSAFR